MYKDRASWQPQAIFAKGQLEQKIKSALARAEQALNARGQASDVGAIHLQRNKEAEAHLHAVRDLLAKLPEDKAKDLKKKAHNLAKLLGQAALEQSADMESFITTVVGFDRVYYFRWKGGSLRGWVHLEGGATKATRHEWHCTPKWVNNDVSSPKLAEARNLSGFVAVTLKKTDASSRQYQCDVCVHAFYGIPDGRDLGLYDKIKITGQARTIKYRGVLTINGDTGVIGSSTNLGLYQAPAGQSFLRNPTETQWMELVVDAATEKN